MPAPASTRLFIYFANVGPSMLYIASPVGLIFGHPAFGFQLTGTIATFLMEFTTASS